MSLEPKTFKHGAKSAKKIEAAATPYGEREPYAKGCQVDVERKIHLTLTQAQFNLIGKALAGTIQEKHYEVAADLNLELLRLLRADAQAHTNQTDIVMDWLQQEDIK